MIPVHTCTVCIGKNWDKQQYYTHYITICGCHYNNYFLCLLVSVNIQ